MSRTLEAVVNRDRGSRLGPSAREGQSRLSHFKKLCEIIGLGHAGTGSWPYGSEISANRGSPFDTYCMRVTSEIRGRKSNPSTVRENRRQLRNPREFSELILPEYRRRGSQGEVGGPPRSVSNSLIFLVRGEYRRSRMVDAEK